MQDSQNVVVDRIQVGAVGGRKSECGEIAASRVASAEWSDERGGPACYSAAR